MTEQEIEEAVDIIDAVFGDHLKSINLCWEYGHAVDVHYAIDKHTNIDRIEAREKVQKLIKHLKSEP